jgi:hypothetical protein
VQSCVAPQGRKKQTIGSSAAARGFWGGGVHGEF